IISHAPADRLTHDAASRLEYFFTLVTEGASASPRPSRGKSTAVTLAPDMTQPVRAGLYSNFSEDQYRQAVADVVEYIRAGDVFQVNLSQRLLTRCNEDPVDLYLRLSAATPAPFSGYFDAEHFQVLSVSPERFLSVRQRQVEARPIKGTRRLTGQEQEDARLGRELEHDPKERAENTMIVDLLRNDLSRACEPASVRVPQRCGLERYGYVQHLVSVVQGQLRPEATPIELLSQAFPGGSVTGAPKLRAMQIISERERVVRGPYCGALGYFGTGQGDCDTSILIRTATLSRGWLQIPVGGGIVADSDPQAEYEETWTKAEPFLRIT
ncbi:MAG: anthranilate synthase component I family protein, partial [Planctomycetota bacterium]